MLGLQSTQTPHAGSAAGEVQEIDLLKIGRAILDHIKFVLLLSVLGAVLALAFTVLLIQPTYRTNFTAFINNRTQSSDTEALTSGDTSASQSLTYTYAAIIESRSVLGAAASQAGISEKYTDAQLAGMVDTSIVSNTQLINIYVTSTDPEEAYVFANAIAEVAPDYVANIVEGSSMKISSAAVMPAGKYSPSTKKNVMLGFMLGLLIAVALVAVKEIFDTAVKSEEELAERFGIPVIGTIPDVESMENGRGYAYEYARHSKSPKSVESTKTTVAEKSSGIAKPAGSVKKSGTVKSSVNTKKGGNQ